MRFGNLVGDAVMRDGLPRGHGTNFWHGITFSSNRGVSDGLGIGGLDVGDHRIRGIKVVLYRKSGGFPLGSKGCILFFVREPKCVQDI
jgi:hypothetical protein